jgi:hypothetical protein
VTTEPVPGRAAAAVERDVKVVLDHSRVVDAAEHAAGTAARTIASSTAAQHAGRLVETWRGLPGAQRRGAIGTVLLAGVATHLGLTAWQGLPSGWLWLVLPALAAGVGALYLLASDGTSS